MGELGHRWREERGGAFCELAPDAGVRVGCTYALSSGMRCALIRQNFGRAPHVRLDLYANACQDERAAAIDRRGSSGILPVLLPDLDQLEAADRRIECGPINGFECSGHH